MRVIEGILGFLLAWATLRDLFDTVVVPGSPRGLLKISRRMVRAALPIAKRFGKPGIGVDFAPVVLGGAFAVWLVLLVTGFGLMVHAFADSFDPPIASLGQALYVAAASMSTMGFSPTEPNGWGAFITVVASFCGLAVVTLAVTYLLEVQANIAHRDIGVLKITTTTGQPPSALKLLERYAALGSPDELCALLREGREWCATVLQSHTSHPWLVYFRSTGTRTGWPAALGALVDLSLIAEMLLDDPRMRTLAILAREEADRLTKDLTEMLSLQPEGEPARIEEAQRLCTRLIAAGYTMNPERDVPSFAKAREEHSAGIRALAWHLGMPEAPLFP
jgi:hypothetical protein